MFSIFPSLIRSTEHAIGSTLPVPSADDGAREDLSPQEICETSETQKHKDPSIFISLFPCTIVATVKRVLTLISLTLPIWVRTTQNELSN